MLAACTEPVAEKPTNEKRAYPLRISGPVLDAMQRWSEDELRSVNAQIEYVLRDALRRAGRLRDPRPDTDPGDGDQPGGQVS